MDSKCSERQQTAGQIYKLHASTLHESKRIKRDVESAFPSLSLNVVVKVSHQTLKEMMS